MNRKLIPDIQKHTVYPVHNNIFKIGVAGRASAAGDMVIVKDIETFEPAIDGNVEEWTPMDTDGWMRRMLTGKSLTVTLTGKRSFGDPGNDYLANLGYVMGNSTQSVFEWTLSDGATLSMPCIINVTSAGGGDSTAVDALEVEIMSDGKPTYAATALGVLTFVCQDGTTAGTTKIAAVSPVLTGGNSYLYKVNGQLPSYDADLTGLGWAAYTLGNDIPVVDGNIITLVEVVTATLHAVKGGSAVSVVV